MTNAPKIILYADDDDDDREMLSNAIASINPDITVVHAGNGLEALDYLKDQKQHNLPCLVVLDINMPLMDGKKTFQLIKEDPDLNNLPIMIFTSSENPNDKLHFTKNGTTFISKPRNITNLSSIAQLMASHCA